MSQCKITTTSSVSVDISFDTYTIHTMKNVLWREVTHYGISMHEVSLRQSEILNSKRENGLVWSSLSPWMVYGRDVFTWVWLFAQVTRSSLQGAALGFILIPFTLYTVCIYIHLQCITTHFPIHSSHIFTYVW